MLFCRGQLVLHGPGACDHEELSTVLTSVCQPLIIDLGWLTLGQKLGLSFRDPAVS